LGVGFLTVAISVIVGTSVGLSAGYFGGLADDVLMRLVDVILSIPRLFLFILVGILFFRSASLVSLSLVIASVGWGATARLVGRGRPVWPGGGCSRSAPATSCWQRARSAPVPCG